MFKKYDTIVQEPEVSDVFCYNANILQISNLQTAVVYCLISSGIKNVFSDCYALRLSIIVFFFRFPLIYQHSSERCETYSGNFSLSQERKSFSCQIYTIISANFFADPFTLHCSAKCQGSPICVFIHFKVDPGKKDTNKNTKFKKF